MMRLALSLLVLLPVTLAAQEGRSTTVYDLGADALGIQGYDPVAYFEEGGAHPVRGDAGITVDHAGVVYRFASTENKELFLSDPERFEPAYGGWCAYAMAKDARVEIDPEAFRVSQGRLFLFAATDYTRVDEDWVVDENDNIRAADQNWNVFSGESPRKAAPGTWRWVNEYNLTGDSLAIEGYDPVSYFPEGGGEPRKGSARYSLRHEGVTYRFADEQNLATFRDDPDKYEPQHGGWCSYAMGATGELVEVDPEAFRLTNGQLHLFYNGWFNDTREDWDADTEELKRKADANWASLVNESTPRS